MSMGRLLNFAILRMNSDFSLCRAVFCVLLKSWLGSLLISLFGMVSQNGVLTACPSLTACSSRGCNQRFQKHPSLIAMIKMEFPIWPSPAIHRSESPPNAHDVLPWWRDCFEPETGSRAVHPYLDGGDAGLTS
ncbi:hypothetical protein CDL15_Pgr002576 [Punica granatum]|uniref:Uncharacterized protein n=1 Tax=Punica granatum TaxID=22663 RepID=A0A218WWQ3_PUNGR|nr:hypothetical protein CDL15_Pgr002576 [Punica granatum]